MIQRVLSALIGAPLILIITWLGGKFLAVTVVILALLALREYLKIGQKSGLIVHTSLTSVFCVIWLAVFLAGYSEWLLPLGILWFIVVFAGYAFTYPASNFTEASFSVLALVYPVMLFSYLYFLRELPQGFLWCVYVFATVWITDTGAYFVGITLGKKKLAPRVSPNKSVEGAVGGLISATLLGALFWAWTGMGTLPVILALSLLTSTVSQVGDLFESALKRAAEIKDSGSLIPGHGGILDRFDSLLFALPLVYFVLKLGLVG